MRLTTEEIKKKVALLAADLVKPRMKIGLGTGSTVYWLIQELGQRVRDGLIITAVPTSLQTARLAKAARIPLATLDDVNTLSLAIDGTDEIDGQANLIKGGGGALLQEKIVAAASLELVIIAHYQKKVDQLGKFPLPVEVIPFGYKQVRRSILESGYCRKVLLRKKEGKPFLTDHKHYILDCFCDRIIDSVVLNDVLHRFPGVVETGLFNGMVHKSIIGYPDGVFITSTYS